MPGWDTGILRFEAAGREGWDLIRSAGALPPALLQWGTGFDGLASQVLSPTQVTMLMVMLIATMYVVESCATLYTNKVSIRIPLHAPPHSFTSAGAHGKHQAGSLLRAAALAVPLPECFSPRCSQGSLPSPKFCLVGPSPTILSTNCTILGGPLQPPSLLLYPQNSALAEILAALFLLFTVCPQKCEPPQGGDLCLVHG